ncbi:arylamine N-acetyltransferase family protein [Rhodococcus artemisiae]|uniref:Arylamine N-acetyltransferase n=1 Tax=Rhodococcus artemisiae TaxID=714159 RepID=A0ABU7LAT8_9NOCA|nr:arylamine N-acetyltransferase [Rhodococcus artemisiae]MEE2058651.1 arylamine N-acetyltransferase [Rhodococcus artemisiae]
MTEQPLLGQSWRTDLFDVPAYLDAVGVRATAPTPDLLEELHGAHVRTFPFGNVDVLLGTHPGVAPDAVQDQLVRRGRGGYCFEHSQIFAAALEHLGFSVRRSLGRVHELSNTRTHMTVIVQIDGERWLCDPGFGFSVTGPVPLRDGGVRAEGDREFMVRQLTDQGATVWALTRGGNVEHFVDEQPVHPADVRAGHFVTSREENSPFVNHLMVMRHMPHAHVTLTERARTVRAPGRATEHTELSVTEVVDTVLELGIVLDRVEIDALSSVVTRLRKST